MKKSLYLGLIACAALAFSSCSKDETVALPNQNGNAIQFATYSGRAPQKANGVHRAPVIKIDNLGSMGVYASYNADKEWAEAAANAKPNFMFDQYVKVETDGQGSYNPLKYWPTTKTPAQLISFFAYGPHTTATTDIEQKSLSSTVGAPVITYTLNTDEELVVDFVAGVRMDVSNATRDEAVKFTLKHELTRLNFSAKLDKIGWVAGSATHQTKVVIKDVKFENTGHFITKADYQFATADTETGTWTMVTENDAPRDITKLLKKETVADTDLAGYEELGVIVEQPTLDAAPVPLFKDNQYYFLIPVKKTGIALNDIKVTFVYDIVTVDSKLADRYVVSPATKTVALPANTLAQGQAYNFIFTFNMDEVKVAAEVAEWNEIPGGNTNVDYTDPQ